ncbi:MAG: hypothetical protein COT74_00470 [Bdellovibrionales bacterium CG10_big_fil_rev_8_21_14_0_10_45_34]|nr:MAG: hypothetical protein COT74_00470 [Bdellovibrionales bacterium CG10_big_fil_rev_8_21_14_0_10_45_34]
MNNSLSRRQRYRFYLMALVTSIGIGNLWRFPYAVAAKGGGGLLIYLALTLFIGLPILIGELLVGRMVLAKEPESEMWRRSSAREDDGDQKLNWLRSRYTQILHQSLRVCSLLVGVLYAIVSSWVLFITIQYGRAFLIDSAVQVDLAFRDFQASLLARVLYVMLHIVICGLVLYHDRKRSFERRLTWVMPLFGVLCIYILVRALSLPGMPDALKFLFYPDFRSFELSWIFEIIGQVAFSLSLGMGTMVLVGGLLEKDDQVGSEGFRISITDTIVSIGASLLILPVVFSVGNIPTGSSLVVFETVPILLSQSFFGKGLGLLFFLILYLTTVAGSVALIRAGLVKWNLSSSVERSTYEPDLASNLPLRFLWKRVTSDWGTGLFFVSQIILALGLLLVITLPNPRAAAIAFRAADIVIIDWLLPLMVFFMSLFLGWIVPRDELEKRFVDPSERTTHLMFTYWRLLVRWGIPIVLFIGLAMNLSFQIKAP